MEPNAVFKSHEPWNKGKLVGQKSPLKLKEIWSIRVRLELSHRVRDLALFNLALDSKLRGCDLVKLKVRDIPNAEIARDHLQSEVDSKLKFNPHKTR